MWCFFFSSRRRHTRLQGDWSSDVCSSDLTHIAEIDGKDCHREKHRCDEQHRPAEIGRASCRERVESSVGAAAVKKKKMSMRGGQRKRRGEERVGVSNAEKSDDRGSGT